MTTPAADATPSAHPNPPQVTFRRVFTTEGKHPYDEVTWETRDVEQTNWRTGETVFEQRGVEFPDFWSVNASTIVTTKYFRGAVGTSQRERSLRQLIDRVVLTYGRAGRENGYFATEAEAVIFEEELTWMLLHQVFAFNSPVWFNVGTSSPQAVSACFILAVDDSMESILNWYREEGLIFKGGSGSGVNLSRIRSSKELLSSGGNASGPVSFMRGADASAGTIKSGGTTRRAAKMCVLDVDHPDILEFVETKVREEEKIRVLRDAGFDMDLGGADVYSVQYQNANNSVRVTDEFMRAAQNGEKFGLRARATGEVIETIDAAALFQRIAEAAWACADPGIQYDDTINDWHTNPEDGRITASNPCSEYLSLDNSSCNLASLNLMKFHQENGTFDIERFEKAAEIIITAMDISICFADFPTPAIGDTTRRFRQLGIGYANLGALLMANGLAYDSDAGRALAGGITSLLTGVAYKRSAELAGVVGPYEGYKRNAAPHTRVMRKHAAASDALVSRGMTDADIVARAAEVWQECLKIGKKNGWRNAQASVIAPTGCLTPGTLVTTEHGLLRLSELGDEYGSQWQELNLAVSTDEGPQTATKFFINGEESTRLIRTDGGYRIQGTLTHRIKVVDSITGSWEWKRLADVTEGDVVPMQLGTMIGSPRRVPLPILDDAYHARDRLVTVPDAMSVPLAELVGHYMGNGSLHAKGVRTCVADADLDVVEHLRVLGKELFNLEPVVTQQQGYKEVTFSSTRLARWWKASGFSKNLPHEGHAGKGWGPHIPTAIRESNDPAIYSAFLRGLFDADGTVLAGCPSVTTASADFAEDIRTMLLSMGIPTTTRQGNSGWDGETHLVRVRNLQHATTFGSTIGFIGTRKAASLAFADSAQKTGKKDRIHLPDEVWREIVPVGHPLRGRIVSALAKGHGISRSTATLALEATGDERIAHALGFVYEQVKINEDGGVQPTYDLSVPSNVTYVANGFISHNTIGFMMDCDTTGIEPDFSLVKFKKLVGGGSMAIVNNTVPTALRRLGYTEETVEAIVEYVSTHGNVVDAPGLKPEHYAVFDCAVGNRAITPMGHVRMMAACQPFVSGAISKTVNMPESSTVEDVAEIYTESWRLGIKALAIYRDNCKVGQPLSDAKAKEEPAAPPVAHVSRKRLPKSRPSRTVSFSVGGAEGYLTAGSYPDNGLGEVFLKLGKQGSTLAGVMDAFSIALSIALQYGVPLEAYVAKFVNMRFEPSGMTDDPDIRMAQSIVDYIFRRLALDHLPFDEREALGIFTADERAQAVAATYDIPAIEAAPVTPVERVEAPMSEVHSSVELLQAMVGKAWDAPLCFSCGSGMRRAGSCFVCEGCGSTSGCS